MPNYQPYQYTPIQDVRGIRLLVLHPATQKNHPLQCNIIHASLDDPPLYEAVSYTWENQKPQLPLICSPDTQMIITPNCEAALRRFRRTKLPRYLWVDAICINQAATKERNAQVSMMVDIYRIAHLVLIWLGPSDAQSEAAFRYIRQAHKIWYNLGGLSKYLKKRSGLLFSKILCTGFTAEAMISLARRSYWSRIWTLQEFAGAKSFLYCGHSKSISAHYLMVALNDLSDARPDTSGAAFRTALHYKCFGISHQMWNLSILDIFPALVNMSASDLRDKVYALKGLFPLTFSGLEVNYEKTPEEVFRDATRAIITNDRSLSILKWVSRNSNSQISPSWAVDWADRNLMFSDTYNASGDSKPLYSFSTIESKLTLYGVKIGTTMECISSRLPTADFYETEMVHNGSPVTNIDMEYIFLKEICSLHKLFARTLFPDFKTFFRTALSFLLSKDELEVYHAYIDDLLTFNLQQGEMPPLGVVEDLFPEFAINRVIFVTADGRFGLADEGIQSGDALVLISGLDSPFVIRPIAESFQLICPAFSLGMMDGEIWPSHNEPLVEFIIK